MKQEDKEKFLACLQQRKFPRQALLFEYVLNKLYDALSQNQGVKNIPQTTAMHLFLYTSLGSRLADSAPEKNIFHYFPRWYACFRRDFENYARFIPTQDFVNCPLLSFWHTNAGYQKCNFKPWLTKTNALTWNCRKIICRTRCRKSLLPKMKSEICGKVWMRRLPKCWKRLRPCR